MGWPCDCPCSRQGRSGALLKINLRHFYSPVKRHRSTIPKPYCRTGYPLKFKKINKFHNLRFQFNLSYISFLNIRQRFVFLFTLDVHFHSARRLIESLIIESAAYCNQKPPPLYLNSKEYMSVNWIIWLILSLLY